MSKLSQIFKNIPEIEPSGSLKDLIMQKIGIEIEKQVRKKLFLSYFGMVASFSAGVYAFAYFGGSFLKSEFWSLFSLAFSDFAFVVKGWNEYLYSLGETLPVINVVAILVPVFGVLLFLNMGIYFKNKSKNIHGHLKFNLS